MAPSRLIKHELTVSWQGLNEQPRVVCQAEGTIPPQATAQQLLPADAAYWAGATTGAPLSLTKTARNLAGFVLLALRPTR